MMQRSMDKAFENEKPLTGPELGKLLAEAKDVNKGVVRGTWLRKMKYVAPDEVSFIKLGFWQFFIKEFSRERSKFVLWVTLSVAVAGSYFLFPGWKLNPEDYKGSINLMPFGLPPKYENFNVKSVEPIIYRDLGNPPKRFEL